MKHSLTEINELDKTAICSVCGPTKITCRNSKSATKSKWRCMSKRKEYNYKYIKKKHNNYRSTCTDNRCEICGKTEKDNGKRLAVDHNHETGMIRGMLCNNCNLGIGYLKDNIDLLKSAIKYLKKKKGHVPFDT